MQKAPGSIGARVTIGIIAGLGIFCLVAWRTMQPKIRTATPDEIRAVLPKTLSDPIPVDKEGQDRYERLMVLLKATDFKAAATLIDTKKRSATDAYTSAIKFWKANPELASRVSAILHEGPLQAPPVTPDDPQSNVTLVTNSRTFTKIVEISARIFADHGDYDQSSKLHLLGILFADRLVAAGGSAINYLVAVAIEGVVNASIDKSVLASGFPAKNTQEILSALSPAPGKDSAFAMSVKEEFMGYAMNILPDPLKKQNNVFQPDSGPDADTDDRSKEPIAGTYDALETAKLYGKTAAIEMANADLPFSKIDRSAYAAVAKDADLLPKEVDSTEPDGFGKTWKKWKYRFAMNNMHNSLGRRLVDMITMGESFIELSYKWRAQREATRVLLASRIYQATHRGKLPATTDGFAPILGKWPSDPYNGLPMIYNSKSEKVYSVGKNLVDDGGDIGINLTKSLDIGLSLR